LGLATNTKDLVVPRTQPFDKLVFTERTLFGIDMEALASQQRDARFVDLAEISLSEQKM
jgi:hypothetical protein